MHPTASTIVHCVRLNIVAKGSQSVSYFPAALDFQYWLLSASHAEETHISTLTDFED
jgi:hypothetical protein